MLRLPFVSESPAMALAVQTPFRLRASLPPPHGGWVTLIAAAVLTALLAGLIAALAGTFRQAVRQGEAGRRAMAAQVEADWRCRALRLRSERDRCLAWVRADPPASTDDLIGLEQEAERSSGRAREPGPSAVPGPRP